MPKYSEERISIKEFIHIYNDHKIIEKLLQNNGEYLIVTNKSVQKKRNRYYYEGHFEGYNRKLIFSIEQARNGQVWNPDKPDQYGFVPGTYNVDKYIYNVWKNMERRCYYPDNENYHRYGAKGVTVADSFKNYAFFEHWYKSNWDGVSKVSLDKDCKSYGGNLQYSPETCILIPQEINMLISTLGTGIERICRKKGFVYCLRYRRRNKNIYKNFNSLLEAKQYKKELDKDYLEYLFTIYDVAEETKQILRNYVEIFEC